MAWQSSGKSNAQLINNLFKNGLIKHERVRDAMLAVDRGDYCPANPYADSPQGIGYAATISAPHMHVHACEYLLPFLRPDSRVLDIGSGSGYLTHVFANLITGTSTTGTPPSNGTVVGIDHIQGLVDMATINMAKSESGLQLLNSGKARFVLGDGRKGYPEGGPYDAIHVGAAAAVMHPALIEQLRAPGRMFIPVESGGESGMRSFGLGGSQYIWVVDKKEDGTVVKDKIFGVSYVPLTDAPKARRE
ncbi:protein-L-isoaspartate(D-aspartate) O-methyltransferase [Paracoccidioides lutzii Pb01]|uniref:Protein-L-isoaspartate O-methyltransferase n=1 Tax=Paracoccidioides lutzii (strain ATCC MYA-826 / Pb01) TaxID=502779 RepID=C1HDJ6_PARBA|nr:protein-L-isoaspartate(D-aspartate) O-methyltransferase [Paracoccidioides lutzii Pb01]EEH39568.2 protein-L-isoaspartate(D-aspartate) O-methyltransferase [Paracoccidioides lutzii Pb01]